jgi:hypothetical protein
MEFIGSVLVLGYDYYKWCTKKRRKVIFEIFFYMLYIVK